ncbi:DNA alkylation repair protein [Taibaiella soli]|uniref:DNA alkylation repair protein n=1 Tax=Taibaiella soli TaxID=1649169 RepID=A0A2W2A924_9BACT|nr:DNA alkylation repair protein [Taibaiella soli]PZF71835.1 DNA alkylation repair protein [Taibaiella soli]
MLLKDIYSKQFYNRISDVFETTIPSFKKASFLKKIFTPDFESKELKARMRHTSVVLHEFLPKDYKQTVSIFERSIQSFRENGIGEDGLAFMFLPDYVEHFGVDDYETSVRAIEFITQFVSCEFAVRPFLLRYEDKMMEQMLRWASHENHKVRRLASEGCRSRLPWAMAVPALKKDPAKILLVLEQLKNDPSEWVRRSVANSLNDIAKDHPQIVLDIAKKWSGIGKETDAIIKHGSRTLLKQGHVEILKHYGLDSKHILVDHFKIIRSKIKVGAYLEFSFDVTNKSRTKQKVRLEYAVYFQKQNGQLSKKVFKISEKDYAPKATEPVTRKQSFAPITTRKYYPGLHKLSIIVNGEEKAIGDFELA